MSENALLTLVVVIAVVALIVVILRQPQGGPTPSQPSVRTILLAAATVLFILTGLGVVPGTVWGLACFAAAFLF